MSRNTKIVKKSNKKSVKKVITEMNIIDGIKNNDLTGLVNCDTIDTIIELYKKLSGCINAQVIANAIEDEKCAQKFYDFAINFNDDKFGLIGHNLPLLSITENAFGENIINNGYYSKFYIRKYIIINSLNTFINDMSHMAISFTEILNYLKKNFKEELAELANSTKYVRVVTPKPLSCDSGNVFNNHIGICPRTEVVLRMFNANPK